MRKPLTQEQKEARKVKRREWYKKNVAEIRAYHRAYRRSHREKVNATLKAWTEKNKDRILERHREYDRKRGFRRRLFLRHKLTVEDYLRLLEDQSGCCAICDSEGPRHGDGIIRLDVDHDHDTGLIRGLLCNPCNTGIGHLHDDVETLKRAVKYLRRADRALAKDAARKKPARHDGELLLDLAGRK